MPTMMMVVVVSCVVGGVYILLSSCWALSELERLVVLL